MTKKINKLSDLEIDEVSLVDLGANQGADIVLSKRAPEEPMEEIDEEIVEANEQLNKADPDSSTVYTKGKDKKKDEAKKSEPGFFNKLVKKLFEPESTTDDETAGNITDMSEATDEEVTKAGFPGMQLPYGMMPQGMPAPGPQNFMPGTQPFPGQPGQLQAGPPLPEEVIQYIQQLEQALAAAQGGLNKPSGEHQEEDVNPFGKNLDDLGEDEITFLQELSKNLEDEETREAVAKAMEAVTKANERAEEAERIAKEERAHRLTQEWVAKARSYTNLPLDADEFGPVLKKAREAMEDEEFDLLTKALNAANETIASVGVLEEIGKRGVEGLETVSKAETHAEEIIKNSNGEVSKEAALAQVFETNPELYDEYLQEKGR